MSGVTSQLESIREVTDAVFQRQAICSLLTLEALIWSSGEYRVLAHLLPSTAIRCRWSVDCPSTMRGENQYRGQPFCDSTKSLC
jgi:hypothetical protein